MSLPPGFLDELRSRVSLAQVVGRKVTWDRRKSQQGRGDMWAPCPFHQEKTASFHVEDRKGFYYCFGCQAKGDAITFVMESENVSFMEAVKILASEAGMQLPERDPHAQERADRRSELIAVMEEAVRFFRMGLSASAGQGARAYLEGRGLGPEAQGRWELGFAPDEWRRLGRHLRDKGISPELIAAAGLEKTSAKGGEPYDVFRNRVMFPIRDGRGHAIAFGGRAMDPDDGAKYLNSPETDLFDKGRQLYNVRAARGAAGPDRPLLVAEGYMDVIALSEAGFAATVAPLGTAITEDQLKLMWRIHPEPVVALDGDRAGRRAAMRVMDLAFPVLEAGQSLRFCLMPEGQDPDDLLKAKGPGEMARLVEEARPMVDLLWQRETEGKQLDSPERRAALDKSLDTAVEAIKDPAIRRHYSDALRERRWQLFNPRRPWRSGGKAARARAPAAASQSARVSDLAAGGGTDQLREAVVLALLIRHPHLIEAFEPALERIGFSDPGHARMAACLATCGGDDAERCREAIRAAGLAGPLEKLEATRHLNVVPALRSGEETSARQCLAEEIATLVARSGAAREIEEALQDIDGIEDEALTWRLTQAADALSRAGRGLSEDPVEYETAPNGVRLDRHEVDALDRLLHQIGHGSHGDRN